MKSSFILIVIVLFFTNVQFYCIADEFFENANRDAKRHRYLYNSYVQADDYDNLIESYNDVPTKRITLNEMRSCIHRGGNCEGRPNECCFNSSCRCNLWGSNCRCQRVGLFQKWG